MSTQTVQCSYKLVPLKSGFIARARQAGLDDRDQPVERLVAEGGEPCRDVLRRARPGEELILASYCPFEVEGPYKEYGPIFILANGGGQEPESHRLPIDGPNPYFGSPFVLRAYSRQERILDAVITSPEEAEGRLEDFLMREDVAFVMARFGAYGCYACRIERAA
ncbi:MAG TPA: DUF1203 domain-containing protein [Telluria sp.]|nr:DUF1203 domain-containing protein [Telluria sp.]